MPPDARSVSFVFHRDTSNARSSPEDDRGTKNFRRRLQDKFDKEQIDGLTKGKSADKETSDRSWHNLSLGQVSTDSKRALRNGADKISKTISSVRTTFGSISQVCTLRFNKCESLEKVCEAASLIISIEFYCISRQRANHPLRNDLF